MKSYTVSSLDILSSQFLTFLLRSWSKSTTLQLSANFFLFMQIYLFDICTLHVHSGLKWKNRAKNNEHVFLISEFSLRYLLIFEDQILVLDFSSTYQKKNSHMCFWDHSETGRYGSMCIRVVIQIPQRQKSTFVIIFSSFSMPIQGLQGCTIQKWQCVCGFAKIDFFFKI